MILFFLCDYTDLVYLFLYHCRFLKALPTSVSTLAQKVDLHTSLKMRSLFHHTLAEYVLVGRSLKGYLNPEKYTI